MFSDGRINFYAPADYSANSEISKFMKQIINEISAKESIKIELRILKQPAEAFKIKKSIEDIARAYPVKMSAKEKREFEQMTSTLESLIPGNID